MGEEKQKRRLVERVLRLLAAGQAGGQAGAPAGTPQELEAADAFFQFMDEMPGGFLIYRASQGEEIIYVNQSLLRIFRCDTMEQFRELTGNSFRGIVHPEDLEAVEKSIWAQITASQHDLDYVEYRIRRRDGEIRWIEDYGHFVHSDAVGDIFYVFLRDATEKQEQLQGERARLVREGEEKERKLQNLIQAYDKERSLINQEYLKQLEVIEGLSIHYESICHVDLEADQIVPYRLSRRTSVLFGGRLRPLPYSQYAPDYVAMWVHPEDREMVALATSPGYMREKLTSSPTCYLNYRVLVEGELQYLQLRMVGVKHHGGGFQVVMGYRRMDEELQQQMEQQSLLAEALAKANLAVTSKNTFLSNMSHDMRTPLNAIFGFTALAKLNIDDKAEVMGCLERVETASRQLLDMISKVLEVSSMSGTAVLEEVECGLRETVGDVCDFLRPQAQEKNIDFTVDYINLSHDTVYTDKEKLRQLTLYLVNNAVTYTNPGGRVAVSVTERGEMPNHYAAFRLSVEDTGVGISAEFLEKIFEPFSREKDSTHSGVHGIGLGLTIAKNIVDMMGGTMEIQSEVNRGSTFTADFHFRVPTLSGMSQRLEPEGSDLRILLVEDNEINREIETELLEEMGFSIDPAENGKIAVEKMERAAPGEYSLILMDLQMPVMNGWEAAAAIRAMENPELSRIPIIALSANMLESDRQKSKESGINAHLLKPMDLALLLRTIEAITGKKHFGIKE